MGITIVQKSDLSKARHSAKKALILAGGAVTGGSFMAGGLKALNDYLTGFSVNDFDMFVGISSGSILAAPLVAGISPEEMLKSLDGTSKKFSKFSAWHFYWPNFGELISRPARFMRKMFSGKAMPSLFELLPSGLFDNGPIEYYIRSNIKKNRLTNDFKKVLKATKKQLYIVASELDGAERVVFGPDERCDVEISKAVQASSAMPGFYKPVRIGNSDYVDGGVQETASIDVAVDKGAELIICYNPFRPHTESGRLAGEGVMAVLNQIFRTFFHSRLHVALDQYRNDPNFKGDIILIEPKDDDKAFFELNPLIFSNRIKAAVLGFKSVLNSIDEHYDEIKEILNSYGIEMTRRKVKSETDSINTAGDDLKKLRAILENRS